MKNKLCKMFGEEGHNVMYTALHNAACATYEESGIVYNYLESTPRASLVCELLGEIEEMGYEIRKKPE